MAKATKKDAPTPEEATRAVRIFGIINLVLGLYMVLEGLAALADMNLPGLAARMVGALGFVIIVIAWGSAAASGLGLILLSHWGRRLAILWGKIIVWLLPISFGLSHNLSEFFSITFGIILVICFYGNILWSNLRRPEFDMAFESE